MRLEQLQFVVTVADLHTIRQAADYLYVTPQNISKSIHQLEEEINTSIFVRSSTGMQLTAHGQIVYDTAVDILQRSDYLKNVFLSAENSPLQTKLTGSLRILSGSSMVPTLYRLQRILMNRYPNIKIISNEYEANSIHNFLVSAVSGNFEKFPYDMVFINTFKDKKFFSQELFDEFDIYYLKTEVAGILMRQDDPLATKGNFSISGLKELPIVAYTTSEGENQSIESLEEFGLNISPVITTNSFQSWEQYIRDGMAYGLVGSDYMITRSPDHGKIIFSPFKEKLICKHFLLTRKKNDLKPEEKVFLEIVRDHFYSSIEQVHPE